MAAALAAHYGAVCLDVDAVVTNIIQNGTSPVSLSARQLYNTAAEEYAQKMTAEAGKQNFLCCSEPGGRFNQTHQQNK